MGHHDSRSKKNLEISADDKKTNDANKDQAPVPSARHIRDVTLVRRTGNINSVLHHYVPL